MRGGDPRGGGRTATPLLLPQHHPRYDADGDGQFGAEEIQRMLEAEHEERQVHVGGFLGLEKNAS